MKVTQTEFLNAIIEIEALIPNSICDMMFPGRRLTLPIVLDDRWCREALQRYMQSTRDKAVYLPSNIQYLADNNGLGTPEEALEKLVQSDWVRNMAPFVFSLRLYATLISSSLALDFTLLVPFLCQYADLIIVLVQFISSNIG